MCAKRSLFTLAAVLATLTLVGSVQAAPPMSEEVAVDHGYRYIGDGYSHADCRIAVSDSVVIFAMGEQHQGVHAWRRTNDDREIDNNPIQLVSRPFDTFDLSAFDGRHWKMIYPGPGGVWVRNVDPLAPESDQGSVQVADVEDFVGSPTIAYGAGIFVTAWVEHSQFSTGQLSIARLSPDLELLDEEPIVISEVAMTHTIDVAMSDSGGMLAWGENRNMFVLPLSAQGLPSGPRQAISSLRGRLALTRLGDHWLLAWLDNGQMSYARLSSQGQILPPGIIHVDPLADGGIDLASNGDLATLVWRSFVGNQWALVAIRIAETGEILDTEPLLLGSNPQYENWDWTIRTVAVSWTGSRFVTAWTTYQSPPTANASDLTDEKSLAVEPRTHEQRGTRLLGPPWPTYYQWIDQDGGLAFEVPQMVDVSSRPAECVPIYDSGGFLLVIRDWQTSEYLNTFALDAAGTPIGPRGIIRTAAGPPYRETEYVTTERIGTLSAFRWFDSARVTYGHTRNMWRSYGSYQIHSEATILTIDPLAPSEEGTQRISIPLNVSEGYPPHPTNYDLVTAGETAFVSFESYSYFQDPEIDALLLDRSGAQLRQWRVVSDWKRTHPRVAPIDQGTLLVWVEHLPSGYELRHAAVNHIAEGDTIRGLPVVLTARHQLEPSLAEGDLTHLCVFTLADTMNTRDRDVYAIRFGLDGKPIDREPLQISRGGGRLYAPNAIWDGTNFLVTWTDGSDLTAQKLMANRVCLNGDVLDGSGFLISEEGFWRASLATDGEGTVAVGYHGNRMRVIFDGEISCPDPTDPIPPRDPDDPVGVDPVLPIWTPIPNPSVSEVWMRIPGGGAGGVQARIPDGEPEEVRARVLDVAGRVVAEVPLRRSEAGIVAVWSGHLQDGRRAPAGVYYFQVTQGEQVTTRKLVRLR